MKHAREDYNRIQDPFGLIPADEPVFLIRGQDKLGPDVLRYYAQLYSECGSDTGIYDAVARQADDMDEWQHHYECGKYADLPSEEQKLPSGQFGFDVAIRLLKLGHRVCRTGWNGKGMWVAMTSGGTFLFDNFDNGGSAKHLIEETGSTIITISPRIDMRDADGSLVIGWLASQTDMLAEDWMVLP